MFSTEPFNVVYNNDPLSNSKNLLVSGGGARAASKIFQGAMTIPIDPERLSGQCDVEQILIATNSHGTIDLHDSSKQLWCNDAHWIRALRLSDDCHSCNILLQFQSSNNKNKSNSNLILQTIRPIMEGQELLLWFSEDLLAMMQMAFLTPSNIQGQKKYVCNKCSILYESPNPLKLHILLDCGRISITNFWSKLTKLLIDNTNCKPNRHSNPIGFNFSLTSVPKQKNAIDLSSTATSLDIKRPRSQPSNIFTHLSSISDKNSIFYRPYSEPPTTSSYSAFKPFQKIASSNTKPRLFLENFPSTPIFWSGLPANPNMQKQNNIHITSQYNDEAQIETLVSSLGKSKEGHVCLYCGKCYSRKYGLKIHIRTHTGYKPLKCKFCLRPFGDPSNLNKHVRLHAEGETPYKCDICGKILVRRRDLERHLKSRHMADMHPGTSIIEESTVSKQEITEEDITDS